MSIQITEISKSFGVTRALDKLSLTVEPGHIYGLLGNNGAGKTTLLNIISSRLYADSGSVLIDDEAAVDNDSALGKIFMMSESNLYPDDMRVWGAFKVTSRFYPSFDLPYAMELADKFNLPLRKKITALSTGYGTIFRLVVALSSGARYLLLDEPVLGLDAQHRDMFYRQLLQRFASTDCAVVLSSHLIQEVAPLLEHAFIINRGHLLRDDSVESLLNEMYSVSGPAALVDEYMRGRQVASVSALGGLKTACLHGEPMAAEGLNFDRPDLQSYFISLMNEEESK